MAMTKVFYLNLPQPPEEIYTKLVETCYSMSLNEQSRQWVHEFHRGELVVAGHEYGTSVLDDSLVKDLELIYKDFFPGEELYFVAGRISNVVGQKSMSPPHCDRKRKLAINYLLKTGGQQVSTCFYKERRSTPTLEAAENRYYKDLTVDVEEIIPEKTWHCFDVQTFHSVNDVETDRFLFSIILNTTNPSLEEFSLKCKNLMA
jgi:hypothetical protein